MKPVVVDNPWVGLRRHTPARIALGRTGISLPTGPHLAFQLAHAQARDAVHHAFDVDAIRAALEALGLSTIDLHSAAADRAVYLQRPDLGRRLDGESVAALHSVQALRSPAQPRVDLALVIADGLSAQAVERHAVPCIGALLDLLRADEPGWRLAPVATVRQARVAIGDEIGEVLGADLVLVFIGERPGLSSPDSMGLYLTWAPRVGRSDAERNCLSNVRPQGLPPVLAASRVAGLLRAARNRRLSGVQLKDESTHPAVFSAADAGFLLRNDAGTTTG